MGNSKSTHYVRYPPEPQFLSAIYQPTLQGNDDDVSVVEAIRVGTSINGKMSAVRRFFCLLATFDMSFSLLVWVMSVMIQGKSIRTVFEHEVIEYDIKTSLFDILLISALRFFFIILAYGLCRITHWWVIAITTSLSGCFILAKVFLYDWIDNNSTLVIIFLLCSFVMSWGEAWFLDFRVVPLEDKASLLLAKRVNEQTPLIDSSYRPYSDGGTEYHSPPESLISSSDDEGLEDAVEQVSDVQALEICIQKALTPQQKEYKRQALAAMEASLDIIYSQNWRTEKVAGESIIQSQKVAPYGKVFKFVGIIDLPIDVLVEVLISNFEVMSEWNPTVKFSKVIQNIDEHTDVLYTISSEGAGGMVASRDFVTVRTKQKRGQAVLISVISTTHLSMPPTSKYIRGEQGPTLQVFTPVDGYPEKCHMQWLLITDLKGWIPQYLIDRSICGIMLDYVHFLHKYAYEQRRPALEV